MNHDDVPMSPHASMPTNIAMGPDLADPQGFTPNARVFNVVYRTGPRGSGGLWDVEVVAENVIDADAAVTYWGLRRHDTDVCVIAVIDTRTLR